MSTEKIHKSNLPAEIANAIPMSSFDNDGYFDMSNINDINDANNKTAIENAYKLNADIRNIGVNGRSKSIYKLNEDFLFVNPDLLTTNGTIPQWSTTPQVNILNIHEFQPDYATDLADFFSEGKLIGAMFKDICDFISLATSPMATFVRQKMLQDAMNMGIDGRINGNGSKLYNQNASMYTNSNDNRNFFTNNPIERIINIFDKGIWTNSYVIPYFGEDWLKSKCSNDFHPETLSNIKGIGILSEEMQGIDYPLHPKFKTDVNANTREINTSFYLVNHNVSWLKRNFDFINCIFSGTSWAFLEKCFIKSPNVYYVECPGRFKMYWATMDIECMFEGKLRKISKTDYDDYFNNEYPSINEDMLWPEYWRLNIKISDLTPNNYNMHANYMLKGDDSNEFKEFTSKSRFSDGLNIVNIISGLYNDISDYVNAVRTNISNQGYASNELEIFDNKNKTAILDLETYINHTGGSNTAEALIKYFKN